MNPLTWQNPEQLFVAQVLKKIFYNSVAELRFYKANWNPEPMVYIAGRRSVNRVKPVTEVQIFSNCAEVTLKVNGQIIKKMQPDGVKVCIFKDIRLKKGENNIEVSAKNGKRVITDACCWIL